MLAYDVVIKNGKIIDTERGLIRSGYLGINGTKIAIITDELVNGKTEIDARGHIVSPGFIDIHSHLDGNADFAWLSAYQGITTTIGGNCGLGSPNIREFYNRQEKNEFPINQFQMVGHSFTLRKMVGIESPYIAANTKQIRAMAKLTERAFSEGAWGLSFGIEYAPGASFEEVIELSKIAAKYDKIIPIHTNVKDPKSLDSLKETIKIAEITGAHILISHFVYQYGTGIMTEALKLVDNARKSGLRISVDSGMYTNFSTSIGTTIYDEDYMKKFGWRYEDLLIAGGEYRGKRLTKELYDEMRAYHKNESAICFTGVEEEIYEALSKDYVVVSSDSGASLRGLTSEGHPQNAGNFARFFRIMVRERKDISLVEAVEKCTIMPADILGLKNKGRITQGADADIVIFDIDMIKDNSDFPGIGEPDAKPDGIDYVLVNGQIIVEN